MQNPQKPVRRKSSRQQKSKLVQQSGAVLSAYIEDNTKKFKSLSSEKYASDFPDSAISMLPPSEAVKREQVRKIWFDCLLKFYFFKIKFIFFRQKG